MKAKNRHVVAAGLAGLVIGSVGVAGAATQRVFVLHNNDEVTQGPVDCFAFDDSPIAYNDPGNAGFACMTRNIGVVLGTHGLIVMDGHGHTVYTRTGRK